MRLVKLSANLIVDADEVQSISIEDATRVKICFRSGAYIDQVMLSYDGALEYVSYISHRLGVA